MLRISPDALDATRRVVLGLTLVLESRPHGISVAGPKHEIAQATAFRLVETAFRGITRFPDTMELIDVEIVMREIPYARLESRRIAMKLLTVLIREEINKQRLVAAEVRTPRRVLRQHLAEYWVMTPAQWAKLQRTPIAQLGVASYRRALTSR